MDEENQSVDQEATSEEPESVNKNSENETEKELSEIVANSLSSNGIDIETSQIANINIDSESQSISEASEPQEKGSLEQVINENQSEGQTVSENQSSDQNINENQSSDHTFSESQSTEETVNESQSASQTFSENEIKDQTLSKSSESSDTINESGNKITKSGSDEQINVDVNCILDNQDVDDKDSDSITNSNSQTVSNEDNDEKTVLEVKDISESENSSKSIETLIPDLSKESSENVSSVNSAVEINTVSESVSKVIDDEKPNKESKVDSDEKISTENESEVDITLFFKESTNFESVDDEKSKEPSVSVSLEKPEESQISVDLEKSEEAFVCDDFENSKESPVCMDLDKSKESLMSVDLEKSKDSPMNVDLEKLKESPMSVDLKKSKELLSMSVDLEKSKESPMSADLEKSKESPMCADLEKSKESPMSADLEKSKESPMSADLEKSKESPMSADLEKSKESSMSADLEKSKESPLSADLEKSKQSPVNVDLEKSFQEDTKTKPNSPLATLEGDKETQKQDESISSQSNNNTSTDDDNLNKSETEGNEIADTEVINCNEIEQVDFNENECQKDKEVDTIGCENESKNEKEEEIDTIGCENESKNEKEEEIDTLESVDEKNDDSKTQDKNLDVTETNDNEKCTEKDKTLATPTEPVAETKHENTVNQKSKARDSVIAVTTPRVTRSERLKSNKIIEMEKLKESTPKSVKTRRKGDKKNDPKDRPVRSAAKLAGNKIKSLVENDFVLEEHLDITEGYELHDNTDETNKMCRQCKEVKICKFIMIQGENTQYICSEQCSSAYKEGIEIKPEQEVCEAETEEFVRKCAQCRTQIELLDKRLYWETMDFCNEDCLGKYQSELGSSCANCKGTVMSSSLGKYCVRFGYDVKQFCSANCLEEYKKGLKVCSYCQKDISTGPEGFLAPVGDKGQFKDFCTQSCMEKYERMSSNAPPPDVIEKCAVCSNSKPVRVEVELNNKTHKLCSEPCFAAFKFVKNIKEGQCDMCRKYFDRSKTGHFNLYYDESPHSFCCKTCMNVYILAHRKIVPCNWCKVKKYNFDMIKKVNANGQLTMMCSLNCLMLYQVSANSVGSRRVKCDFCLSVTQVQYHLTMSDASVRNFCSYNCVLSFQNEYPQQAVDIIAANDQIATTTPTGTPQKRIAPRRSQQVETSCVPVISSVQSLAAPNGPASPGRVQIPRADVNMVAQVATPLTMPATVTPVPAPPPPPQIYQQIITKPPEAKQMKNKSVLCKPYSHTKGVSCRPHPCMKETQTDQSLNRKFLIPVPVPIYVPAPMHMFATPFPVPVPFPLPIPVPVFIPTTRNSAKGIMKEIKRIQEKIPTDPFEAELLMMAEMVAGDKKQDPTDSESDDGNDGDDGGDGTFSPENVDTSNTFGDDMLQMALKMASELEEPAVDMESVLTSNTITTSTQPPVDPNKALYAASEADQVNVMAMNRGRKRSVRGSRNSTGGTPSKRGRRTSGSVDVPLLPPPEPVPPPRIEVEKPDANMCLKYTFGVNAWRHWVMQKNAELEKAAMTNRKIKLFKPELLQLTADELNFSLCLFVKEVRKPNGTEYAPDTIYYLCLGIQQYLFENGRIDNIFTDSYYEKFTDCLDEVAKKFAALYNDSQYIVTRVEEEHLWESKQLGAHSPHVLLSTLMFFNTKHFNLVTVEEHMQLSFSHIMKHWKRNPNTPGVAKVPGSRNVLLRFYPPQSALEANSRKKKVYEQQENEENPLRCPVKLYEFYLSKCPESVKTRNDVFYLLPERSCVPDSPVWYSTMALGKEPLMKMLHRVKMVKEINIALLSC